MVQNRNKLIDLFIGNIANTVLHRILENAIDNKELGTYYHKESLISLAIANKYREKINPLQIPLPAEDAEHIKSKIVRKVKSELALRIAKGYGNLNLETVESFVEECLKETRVI